MNTNNIECFALDMDGTLYLEDTPICGAADAVKELRRRARVVFLTNNTSVSNRVYYDKLKRMGFDPQEGELFTAADATALRLIEKGFLNVFLLGTPELAEHFEGYGIKAVDANRADAAVLGFDKTVTYDKLAAFCTLLRTGAPYFATHPDINCPVKNGFIPDAGSFIELIKASTERVPDEICGKPNARMGEELVKYTGIAANKIAMVGDRLYTDIRFAINSGFYSVLVLTGETDIKMYERSGIRADKVVNIISDIISTK